MKFPLTLKLLDEIKVYVGELIPVEEKDNVPIVIDGPILITMYAGIIRIDGINLIVSCVLVKNI
jgi:hypothetical protein